jgi:hypothetical protein
MKKDDVIWLLIRIAGFYFLLQSAERLIGLVLITSLQPAQAVFLQSALLIVFYASLGSYMLLNGKLFFQVLSQADEEESQFPSLKDNS